MRTYKLNAGRVTLPKRGAANPGGGENAVNRNYSGPGKGTVLASNKMRIENIGCLGQYEYLKQEVRSASERFIENFFKVLAEMHHTIDVNWVNSCKKRHQEMFAVFTAITEQPEDNAICIITKKGKIYNPGEIKFAPKGFTILSGSSETDEIQDVYIQQNYPKIYAPILVAILKVASACQQVRESDPELFKDLKHLAFCLYETGGLYNETNPDPKEWRRQEEATLEMLTNPPTRMEDEEVMRVFEDTMNDIRKGCEILKRRQDEGKIPRYVLEFCKAITSNYYLTHSPYNDDDLYVSMSSDAATVEELRRLGVHASIIKSAMESDPFRDCEFDVHVGYKSHYNRRIWGEDEPIIITIHIPNPGKFKTRAIHIAVSAVQDRCAYIHNRAYRLLQSIPSDCTKDQSKGVNFLIKITDPTWRSDHGWPSVLAYDWSNATDKLWSWFQEQVLGLVFDKEIVDFWHKVSTCKKLFKFRDGTREWYKQINGQPQGLLGSFDAFALAHHVIMLMTMNMSGRKHLLGSEFYRVLGDDSIICSVTLDRENLVGNSYIRICAWCNVPVNRSKSTEILFDQEVALVEFAKVYALDGEYFSPIPERLANRIGSFNNEYYAFAGAFWGQRHGMENKLMIKNMIQRYYPDPEDAELANILMFSGVIPCFAELGPEFSNAEMALSLKATQLALSYWYNKLKATFALNALSDKAKEALNFSDKELKDALLEMIPEHLEFVLDHIEDNEHKLMKVLQTNLDKEDVVRQFLGCSPDQALVIAASVKLTQDEVSGIRQVLELIEILSQDSSVILDYSLEIANLKRKLEPLDRLNYRSVYKRDTLNLKVFRPTIETYKKLFGSGVAVR